MSLIKSSQLARVSPPVSTLDQESDAEGTGQLTATLRQKVKAKVTASLLKLLIRIHGDQFDELIVRFLLIAHGWQEIKYDLWEIDHNGKSVRGNTKFAILRTNFTR